MMESPFNRAHALFGRLGADEPFSTRVLIRNLPPTVTLPDLFESVGSWGPIAHVEIERKPFAFTIAVTALVTFMNRMDMIRFRNEAVDLCIEGQKVSFDDAEKVAVPSMPIYRPPSLRWLEEPAQSTGLLFNAMPVEKDKVEYLEKYQQFPPLDQQIKATDCFFKDYVNLVRNAVIKVTVPIERTCLKLIDRTAMFVAEQGSSFEKMVIDQHRGDPSYKFLMDYQTPEHVYYRWRMFSLLMGEGLTNWRREKFRMFKNGSWWTPPIPLEELYRSMPKELYKFTCLTISPGKWLKNQSGLRSLSNGETGSGVKAQKDEPKVMVNAVEQKKDDEMSGLANEVDLDVIILEDEDIAVVNEDKEPRHDEVETLPHEVNSNSNFKGPRNEENDVGDGEKKLRHSKVGGPSNKVNVMFKFRAPETEGDGMVDEENKLENDEVAVPSQINSNLNMRAAENDKDDVVDERGKVEHNQVEVPSNKMNFNLNIGAPEVDKNDVVDVILEDSEHDKVEVPSSEVNSSRNIRASVIEVVNMVDAEKELEPMAAEQPLIELLLNLRCNKSLENEEKMIAEEDARLLKEAEAEKAARLEVLVSKIEDKETEQSGAAAKDNNDMAAREVQGKRELSREEKDEFDRILLKLKKEEVGYAKDWCFRHSRSAKYVCRRIRDRIVSSSTRLAVRLAILNLFVEIVLAEEEAIASWVIVYKKFFDKYLDKIFHIMGKEHYRIFDDRERQKPFFREVRDLIQRLSDSEAWPRERLEENRMVCLVNHQSFGRRQADTQKGKLAREPCKRIRSPERKTFDRRERERYSGSHRRTFDSRQYDSYHRRSSAEYSSSAKRQRRE